MWEESGCQYCIPHASPRSPRSFPPTAHLVITPLTHPPLSPGTRHTHKHMHPRPDTHTHTPPQRHQHTPTHTPIPPPPRPPSRDDDEALAAEGPRAFAKRDARLHGTGGGPAAEVLEGEFLRKYIIYARRR